MAYAAGSVRYFVNGALQAAPVVTAGPPLTITGLAVPAGGNALILYETEVTQYAPLSAGSEITNTAVITGGGGDITVTAVVPLLGAAELTISKAVSPESVSAGDELTYTFVIQNTGAQPTDAADAVTVTDAFTPVLTGLTASLDGAVLTSPADYSYDETTGLFTTTPGRIAVPGATAVQDAAGAWTLTPGSVVLTVTGTV